jgi:hypothetical protein
LRVLISQLSPLSPQPIQFFRRQGKLSSSQNPSAPRPRIYYSSHAPKDLPIIFVPATTAASPDTGRILLPTDDDIYHAENDEESASYDVDPSEPDYGDLDFDALPFYNFQRMIDPSDSVNYNHERQIELDYMNEEEPVDPMYDPDDELQRPRKCERVNWQSSIYPVCNTIHELNRVGPNDKYLG